jgi:hypothetical protein
MHLMLINHCLLTCINSKNAGKNFKLPSFYLAFSQTLLIFAFRYYLGRKYPLLIRLMLKLEEHLSHLQVLWKSTLLLLFLLGIMILCRGSIEVIVNLVLDNVPIMIVVATVLVVEAVGEASRNVLIMVVLITYVDTPFFTYQYLESRFQRRLYLILSTSDFM